MQGPLLSEDNVYGVHAGAGGQALLSKDIENVVDNVEDWPVGQDGQRVRAGRRAGLDSGIVLDRQLVKSSRGWRGAEPTRSRQARGLAIVSTTNPNQKQSPAYSAAQPEKHDKKIDIKKEMEYSLSC